MPIPQLLPILILALMPVSSAAGPGEFLDAAYEGPEGARRYRLYVPAGHDAGGEPRPLVVMLHGCAQDAADFAAGTRMNALADSAGLLVAYPEQPPEANPQRCWNWYDPAHQRRGAGEPAILAGLTREVVARWRVDPARVYVAGMSAGGAMAAVLAAAYPDLYAALGVHSALQYRAAASVPEALAAMRQGGPDPAGLASAAHEAMGRHARVVPAIVVHGAADPVVNVRNAAQLAAQWTGAGDLADDGEANGTIDAVADGEAGGTSPGGLAWRRTVYRDAAGRAVVETWIVDGLGHAWSGGDPAGTYTGPLGPDASRAMLDFFLRHARGG